MMSHVFKMVVVIINSLHKQQTNRSLYDFPTPIIVPYI